MGPEQLGSEQWGCEQWGSKRLGPSDERPGDGVRAIGSEQLGLSYGVRATGGSER